MYPKKFVRSESDYVLARCAADEEQFRAQGYRLEGEPAGLPSAADLDAVEAEKESAKPRRNKRSAQ